MWSETSTNDDFAVLTAPGGGWSSLSLQRSDAPRSRPNRLHLDLSPDDQMAGVRRLLGLGAGRPDWTYPADADFVGHTDPDGNEFCVVSAPARAG